MLTKRSEKSLADEQKYTEEYILDLYDREKEIRDGGYIKYLKHRSSKSIVAEECIAVYRFLSASDTDVLRMLSGVIVNSQYIEARFDTLNVDQKEIEAIKQKSNERVVQFLHAIDYLTSKDKDNCEKRKEDNAIVYISQFSNNGILMMLNFIYQQYSQEKGAAHATVMTSSMIQMLNGIESIDFNHSKGKRFINHIIYGPYCEYSFRDSMLFLAIQSSKYHVLVPLLLRSELVDINTQAEKGVTMLMYFAECANISEVRLCIKYGANVSIQNHDGNTAYDIAWAKTNAAHIKLNQYCKNPEVAFMVQVKQFRSEYEIYDGILQLLAEVTKQNLKTEVVVR